MSQHLNMHSSGGRDAAAMLGAAQVELGQARANLAKAEKERDRAVGGGRAILGAAKAMGEYAGAITAALGATTAAGPRRFSQRVVTPQALAKVRAAAQQRMPQQIPAQLQPLWEALQANNAAVQTAMDAAIQQRVILNSERARKPTTAAGVLLQIPAGGEATVTFQTPYDGEPWVITAMHASGGGVFATTPCVLTAVTVAGINHCANSGVKSVEGAGVTSVPNVWTLDIFSATATRPAAKPELSLTPWALLKGSALAPSATVVFKILNPGSVTQTVILKPMIQASPCGGLIRKEHAPQILPPSVGYQLSRRITSAKRLLGGWDEADVTTALRKYVAGSAGLDLGEIDDFDLDY
ncbi:hypothetical protein [Chondromyces apiculatus]|uniref:Uncharacterized protein n=1 Tax=Chondromyces apiculatus DSM 436 TaxID=1192034 RepID=A0A017TCS3_9BACT|nr:hypothetical protein [Chondromyces apiculatus]EYF07063.1 Hypothetical protein CAP_1322 [Chondromyces apiculatus DSM 436]